jgi:hypothetical protein
MSQLLSDNPRYKSNIRNVQGTLAAEGMTLSKSARNNLERIASGEASYQRILQELRARYEKRG